MPAGANLHAMHMSSAVTAAASLEPFTFRAPLDPFRIAQKHEFAIRSKDTKDIVIQQSVFQPGAGPWHTHPGPSFIYVVQGRLKLERVVRKNKCVETPEHGVGQAYYEIGEQVHRAVVVSAEPAVLMVVRFNIPVGAPFTIPAADPGCKP
jgi:quercetin dioxygenase-like cupin family protein